MNVTEVKERIREILALKDSGRLRRALQQLLGELDRDRRVIMNIDGGARPDGRAASAFVVQSPDGEIIFERGRYFPEGHTSNMAEYRALIEGLSWLSENGYSEVEVISDSELLVNQVNRKYKVKNENLRKLLGEVRTLQEKFRTFSICAVPREKNRRADLLSSETLDAGETR